MRKPCRGLAVRNVAALQRKLPFVRRLGMGILSLLLLMLGRMHTVQATPGDLDATFGSSRQVITNFPGSANAAVLEANGKLVVAGGLDDFVLARFNANGSLDTTFGHNGSVTTDFGGDDVATAMALQTNGKIMVAGNSVERSSGNCDIALARFNTNGTLDTTFGNGGKLTTDLGGGDFAQAIAIEASGKIVVVVAGIVGDRTDFALVRYNANGAPIYCGLFSLGGRKFRRK